MKAFGIRAAALAAAISAATPIGATMIQVTELGQIVSYMDAQFLTGNGGQLLGRLAATPTTPASSTAPHWGGTSR